MANDDFFKQYKDPQWQKRRLEIMQRDEFRCTSCGMDDTTLNVHHCVPYRKGVKVWEYEDSELKTVCENCHQSLTEYLEEGRQILMSLSWCVDSASETMKIMRAISTMNIHELCDVWKLLEIVKRF